MGVYQYANGALTPIAGKGKAEYGASTMRKGTWSFTEAIPVTAGWKITTITFTDPMPDTDYEIIITPTGQVGVLSQEAITPYQINNKTVNGFTLAFWNNAAEAGLVDIQGTYTAFKLYTDTEYNNILAAMPSSASLSNELVTASDVTPIDVTQDFINHCTLNTEYYPNLAWNSVGTATWIRKCGHIMEAKFNISIPSASAAKDLVPSNANTVIPLFTFTKYKPAFTNSKACMVSGYTIGAGSSYQDGLVFCMEKEGSVACHKSAMFPADANITYFWPDTMMWFTND